MAKRKRNVSKRKVPKRRKRRKRKFGSVLDTVSTAISPVKEEIAAVIASNVPEGDDLKKKIGEKVSDAKKVNILSTNITQIKQELIKDIQADKFTFSNLKKYINEKGNIAVESLYSMIDNLGLRDKITAKLGPKAFILKSASGLLPAFYKSLKGSPKLIMNILGNIVFKKPDVLQQKIKNDKNEENYELLILAKETAVQGATAAVDAGKKAVTGAKAESKPPAEKPKEDKATTTKEEPKTQFGKRKKGPSASLKRMCKKHGVRLTVKRGKKRVYKSSKVLKEQCKNKLKNKLKKNKKKNFGRKKIKRSSIMPPRRKTRVKKRRKQKGGAAKLAQILKASAKRQAKKARRGARSAARYARRNPRRSAGYAAAGLAGLGALGLGGLEARRARERYLLEKDNPYFSRTRRRGGEERLQSIDHLQGYRGYQAQRKALESPTGRFFRGVKNYPYRKRAGEAFEGAKNYDYIGAPGRAYRGARKRAGAAFTEAYKDAKATGRVAKGFFDSFRVKKTAPSGQYGKRKRRKFGDAHKNKPDGSKCGHTGYGKRRRRSSYKFGGAHEKKPHGSKCSHNYGKRRRRKSKYDFGKKAKKPSAATRRMCKKLKVRLTLKRGGKRVYKSEAMLKKQCKNAMKRKTKK